MMQIHGPTALGWKMIFTFAGLGVAGVLAGVVYVVAWLFNHLAWIS
jgi:hypothetical protein